MSSNNKTGGLRKLIMRWPYGFNQAYGSVWSSSGATCENALQAFTGFDTTVKYVTDGDGGFGVNDTCELDSAKLAHEHDMSDNRALPA